ncbi:MAG TPA: DUF932 domain-containing protein [Crocinitomicaceae bacterium]|nr:DUF932 domain-containing protein [Crocinitomicaceae bacterium]
MKKGKNAFNWDIKQTAILDIHGNPIKGYKQITRDDDNSSIAVMKESYTPMTTQQFSDTANEVANSIGGTGLEFKDWNDNSVNGQMGTNKPVVTCQMKISEPLEIAGSKIEGKLTIGVGFDGGRSFFIGHTNTYLRCTNEFSSIVKDFKSRLTVNNMVRVEDIIKNIQTYKDYEKSLYENFERFQNVKVDEKIVQECLARLVGLTVEERAMSIKERNNELSTQKLNKMDEILASIRPEMSELGNNAWGIFNGVTHYSTHIMKSRGSNELSTMFGAKAKINKIAYDFCLELL